MRSAVRWVLAGLIAVHVVSAAAVAFRADWTRPGFTTGDNLRYREIARARGLPYRDDEVEYPPLAWLAIEVVDHPHDTTTSGRLLVLSQLVADLVIVAALARGWDPKAAVAWLLLLLPFCWGGWIFARLDLLAVALAISGIALSRSAWARRGERAGGALVGLAVFAKAWPLVTLPGLALTQRRRALEVAGAIVVIGGAAWLLFGGVDGVLQVVTFRDAKGWQVESTVGAALLLDLARPAFSEANALRIGSQAGWAKVLLALALVGGTALAWVLAWTRRASATDREQAADLASLVAVGLLLVLSPLLSPQFLVWLVPFVAIRWRDRWLVGLMAAAMVLTAYVVQHYATLLESNRLNLSRVLVLRNALLIAIVAVGFARLAGRAGRPPVPSAVSGPGEAYTARRTRR